MNAHGYADFVRSLFVKRHVGTEGLMHAAVGLAGESGEVLDLVKKTWVHGRPIDAAKLQSEVGDVCFYLFAMLNANGWTLDDVIRANVEKLTRRYPNGYSDAAAAARADEAASCWRAPPRALRSTLPADVARCEPSKPCAVKDRCLRYLDGLPSRGASLTDGSVAPDAAELGCALFIDAIVGVRPT